MNADGSFNYASPPNANGMAGFTYVVSDGFDTATGTVTLTVDPVNDPPTFELAQNPAFAQGTAGQRTVPNFATMTTSGPPDEHDNVLAWHVRTVSDPDGILGGPVTISVDGTLLEAWAMTYRVLASGVIAIPPGKSPTRIGGPAVPVAFSPGVGLPHSQESPYSPLSLR